MKFLILKFPIFVQLIFAMAIVGCVGDKKPTTNAQCEDGFSFDAVSRSCFAAGKAPVATLSQVSVIENSGANLITLTYKDGNNDFARSCRVENDSTSRIEISSPRVYELASRSINILTMVEGLYNVISPMGLASRDLARSATAVVRSATSLTIAQSGKSDLINAARALAATAIGTGLPVAISASNAILASTEDYENYFSTLGDRCLCEVGVCRSVLVPRTDITGNAGFRYSVSDLTDGSSSLQNVTVNISAINKRPVARSGELTFAESDSTTPNTDFFVTQAALSPLFGTTYSLIQSVNFGSLDICSSGGSIFFPGLCSYTPVNGDLSDTYDENGVLRAFVETGAAAEIVYDQIRYTAAFIGSAGNNIRIRYSAYQGLGFSPEGTVKVSSDATGPIIEVVVIPNQTLRSFVQDQVNDALYNADLFVTALDESVAGSAIVLTGTAALVGGEDAQDVFKYQACNGMLCSEGAYTFRITENDDKPYVISTGISFANTAAPLVPITQPFEDIPFDIVFSYDDPDGSVAGATCSATPVNLAQLSQNPCSCVGTVCRASMTPAAHFNGATSVQLAVSNDQPSDNLLLNFNLTAVNDEPYATTPANAEITFFVDGAIDENDGDNINVIDNVYLSELFRFHKGGAADEQGQLITFSISITDNLGDPQTVIPHQAPFIEFYNGGVLQTADPSSSATEFIIQVPNNSLDNQFRLRADKFKSTTAPLLVTIKVMDNGGVANGGVDTRTYPPFNLDVDNVDFPPTITQVDPVQANEGGEVYSPLIFITEGGESNEPTDTIDIRVVSDNTDLLPPENITLHYNLSQTGLPHLDITEMLPGPSNAWQSLGDGANPSADAALILRMKPVGGLVTGTANITVYARDAALNVTTMTFPLIIHPISARHGGWNQIKAVSNKVFSSSQLDPNRFCQEETATTSCGTDPLTLPPSLCRDNVAPNSSTNAHEEHSLFFDFANKRCYFSTGLGVANWQELNTFCPITKSDENSNCIGASCMGAVTPTAAAILPTAVDQYYFDYSSRTCYRSEGLELTDWVEYFPSQVTLGWNDFIMAGSGADTGALITGWQIFRRRFNTPFDFSSPLDTLESSARSYLDYTVNENTLYYYVVRPIDNKRSIATATNDLFSEIRVMTPPRNMSFVHRWMVNQEVCGKMGKTIQNEMVDPENNFRCEFTGPGAVQDGTKYYYDIGRDLLVDIAEAGCPFTPAPACSSNGCIAVGSPIDLGVAAIGNNIFYNRSNGVCYRAQAGNWVELETAAITDTFANATQSVLLPPLVNVTQAKSQGICSTRILDTPSDLLGLFNISLPSRLDQIAFSAQPLNLSDTVVEQLERGLSLNTSSKCNGSAANGVSVNYTSGQVPPSSFYYTLPGSSSSGIRSVVTGSTVMGDFQSTQACVSRYGIQDVYGNVAEWVEETMTCSANTCTGNAAHINFDIDGMSDFLDPLITEYGFDGELGPCRDINADGICDPSLTSWLIQDKANNANFFSFPMGLPIHRDFVFDFPSDPIAQSSLEIGPTSGITNAQLKRDAFIINSAAVEEAVTNVGGLAVGGGYTSGDGAGRYSFELVPNVAVPAVPATGGDILSENGLDSMSFVAEQLGSSGNLISVVIVERTSVGGGVTVSVSGSSIVVSVPSGGAIASDIETAILDGSSPSSALIDSVNYALDINYRGSGSGNFLSGGLDSVEPKRSDIGFRCMTAVEYQPPFPFDPNGPTWYPDDPEFNY